MCTCRICEVAGTNGLKSKKNKRKRGRPLANTAVPAQSHKVCSRCFARIYIGSNHTSSSCLNSRREKLDNIVDLVSSPTSLERIAGRTINKSGGTLSSLGKRKKLVASNDAKKVLFRKEDIMGISQDLQLSNKATRILSRDIRIATGKYVYL